MSCTQIDRYLEDYIADQLDPVMKEMVESHLADCPECREKLKKAQSVSSFLKQMDVNVSTRSISGDLLKRLENIDKEETLEPDKMSSHSIPARLKWSIIMFMVMGLVVIGIFVFSFEPEIHQKHIGGLNGPGFTWIGENSPETEDYDLLPLTISAPEKKPEETTANEDRVTDFLEFDDAEVSSEHSNQQEAGD